MRAHGRPSRRALMWVCLAMFVIRVLGQVEVSLCEPSWLPPFAAWESGLIPYPVLLPLQILVIAWMAVIAADHWRSSGFFWVTKASTGRCLRLFALTYAAVMALRLVVTAILPPHTLLERGLIPVLAHWDLAAFIALASNSNGRPTRPCDILDSVK